MLGSFLGIRMWIHSRDHEQDDWLISFVYALPLRFLSRCWGAVHNIELPVFLRARVYNFWTRTFNCKLDEMKYPIESYRNLAEFFSRPLKDGIRPIANEEVVSPVDAKVTRFGLVDSKGLLEQIKGSSYPLVEFLGFEPVLKNKDSQLYFCVLYLAPGDYHRIHASSDFAVTQRVHIPGKLLSVAPIFLERIPRVFSSNERIVLAGDWDHGFYSLTSVGAYNVGSIKLTHEPEVVTNKSFQQPNEAHPYGPNSSGFYRQFSGADIMKVKRGDEVARFELGSTVVLVFEAPKDFGFTVFAGDAIRMGEPLGASGKNWPATPEEAKRRRKAAAEQQDKEYLANFKTDPIKLP